MRFSANEIRILSKIIQDCFMKILLVEPYFTGSHAAWAKGYQKFGSHHINGGELKRL